MQLETCSSSAPAVSGKPTRGKTRKCDPRSTCFLRSWRVSVGLDSSLFTRDWSRSLWSQALHYAFNQQPKIDTNISYYHIILITFTFNFLSVSFFLSLLPLLSRTSVFFFLLSLLPLFSPTSVQWLLFFVCALEDMYAAKCPSCINVRALFFTFSLKRKHNSYLEL